MYLVISTSLNPESRSRLMALSAVNQLENHNEECQLVDLAKLPLPPCDGAACYGDPNVQQIAGQIQNAHGILVASPIYNYDISAAGKNLVELTGKAWTDKIVGFLCAAGGGVSYMSVMGIANSLMLDFRCLILPRFVYATGDAFSNNEIVDPMIEQRIQHSTNELVRVSTALRSTPN